MAYTVQLDTFVSRLNDETDYKASHSVLSELLDMIETFNGAAEYEYFLKNLVPIFIKRLNEVPVSFNSVSPEHKLRNSILEIIHRSIMNETFQPYAEQILNTLTKILVDENEDNGVLCMKIITSLHKTYKASLSDKVQPFVDIINEIYENMNQTVKDVFEEGGKGGDGEGEAASSSDAPDASPAVPQSGPSFSDDSSQTPKILAKAMFSFKTLADCPITMVSLYSSYKNLVQTSLPVFLPNIINILTLQVEQQRKFREEAEKEGKIVTSLSPDIKNRQAFSDLILGQVKAASFLAYVFIRGYANQQLGQEQSKKVPDVILRLLQDCPAELSVARKELLHATRHILSTPFRVQFIPKIELLFDEKILIGEGLTSFETLRPLAYSTVADFIHNVRNELTPKQIWSTVRIYCDLLKDDSLALTVQIMSAKLLLNLVERIMKLPNKLEGRQLFMIIIDSYAKRFQSLNRKYDYIINKHNDFEKKRAKKERESKKAIQRYSSREDDSFGEQQDNEEQEEVNAEENEEAKKAVKSEEEESSSDKVVAVTSSEDVDMEDSSSSSDKSKSDSAVTTIDLFNIEELSPITSSPINTNTDLLKDARYLFRTLMTFLKSVIFGLKNCNPPVPPQPLPTDAKTGGQTVNYDKWNDSAKITSFEEVNILRNLFRGGISCLRFFSVSKPKLPIQTNNNGKSFDFSTGGPNLPITSSKEEKDLMEIFATIFIHIDPASFNEIVTCELPFMFESMLDNAALLHLPQFFLASEITSANFSGILISFLKSKLDQLGKVELVRSNILIRLFKLCFMSVNLFPAANEGVIQPHLNYLILESLNLATKAEEPIVYSYLVRILFRSISGGRFENLYKEIMPILPVLLESLNKMIVNSRRPYERDIYVELCLTVPVRLSVLVPHLNYLTRPLVYALNGSQELVTQGLRTFELCVDNLTAEYFDPMIEPVIDEIMAALWKHLEPVPYHHQHSHTAIRILGKLGGRNHKNFKPCNKLIFSSELDQEVEALFTIHGLNGEVPVSITPGIKYAIDLLEDPRLKIHYRISAFKYLSGIVKLFIDTRRPQEGEEHYIEFLTRCIESLKETTTPEQAGSLVTLTDSSIQDPAKLDRQQKLFLRLLEILFFSISIPELKEEASALIDGITTHFTLIYVGTSVIDRVKKERAFSVNDKEGKAYIDETTFLNAINYALSFWDKDVRQKGIDSIKKIYDTSVIIFGGDEPALYSPIFRTMFYKFTHCCYNEYYHTKLGGILGLKTLFEGLRIPPSWFFKRQFELVRSIFFILRDTPDTAPFEVRELAKDLVLKILHDCNEQVSKETVLEKPFQTLIGALVYDLASANPLVREVSQKSLKVLSDTTGVPIAKIMGPCKQLLLTPIFGKPLRALPFPMQIGNIDAITFCLGLDDTFLTFGDELNRLLLEALALVDAEDESLANVHRLHEHRTAKQLIELRVVCIKLLSLALTKPDFSLGTLAEARIRILGVFFKALCNKSIEIINAAHLGLKSSLQENAKLPKELLQNGLRPMLMNLSDHKKLTVSGLEALARLLELLISYFRVEIGRKLLDHLMAWAQINTLRQIASQDLANNHTVQIVMAILNIFHLLPAKAYTFMEEIIGTLQYLEGHLDRHQNSPFRIPVSKFLNRFPDNCLEYYLQNYKNRKLGNMLASFAGMDDCDKIREVAKSKVQGIYEDVSGESDPEVKVVKFANMIDLLESLSSHDEKWFTEQRELLLNILKILGSIVELKYNASLVSATHFQADQSVSKFLNIIVNFLKLNPTDTSMVFTIIEKLCSLKVKIPTEFEDFIFKYIVCSEDIARRELYLNNSITFLTEENDKEEATKVSLKSKIFCLKKIVNSILLFEINTSGDASVFFTKKDEDGNGWLDKVCKNIWRSTNDIITDHTSGTMDSYRFELLELTSILLKWCTESVSDFRKDIIKFSWNYIKLEDNITKQVAYVTTSFFISAFEIPSKLATQVFVALLKTHQTDSRHLVRQALDILAPVMSDRIQDTESPMSWLKWPRRVISEDGFNVTQVLNVYQFIVQHPDLFFVAREHFISNIITAMGKLTILANPALENQVLAIELSELILKWETKAAKERRDVSEARTITNTEGEDIDMEDGEKDGEDGEKQVATKKEEDGELDKTTPESASDFSTSSNYSIPFGQREACVTFLIRYVCISPQRASESELGQKALGILYDLLSPDHWSEVSVKLTFFEKFLLSNDLNSSNLLGYCLNALEVLGVVLEWKKPEWIVSNLAYLQKLLEKCIKSDNHDIQEVLQRVLRIILKAINQEKGQLSSMVDSEEEDEVKEFISLLVTTVSEDLGDMPSVAAGVTLSWTLANYRPSTLDSLSPSIMRTFSKLCKDHITITHHGSQASSSGTSGTSGSSKDGSSAEFEAKMTTKLLEKILNLSSMRISNLGDQRRIFLSLLAQLIERSLDKGTLEKIIKMVKSWVFSRTDLFPTTKEKAAILAKMMVFEIRGEPTLSKDFYQIIVDIFEDDTFSCTELTVRMEQPFLVGTRSADVSIRRKLMSILNNSLEKDISKRLYYVIREQNWEYLADYPWLNQALQLLFGAFEFENKLELVSGEYKLPPLESDRFEFAQKETEEKTDDKMDVDNEKSDKNSSIAELVSGHFKFLDKISSTKAGEILEPLIDMFYQSSQSIHKVWSIIFPIAFKSIPRSEHLDFTRFLVILLSKDYHTRQTDSRPNVIQSLLEGIARTNELQLPPFAIECLASNFNAWSQGIQILETIEKQSINGNAEIREITQDALAKLYATLKEDDMFYGLWRRRAKYSETIAALSFEQIGLWDKAQQLYETAQIKARSGALPYGESEYALWEDHWILCAEKLQHWDILTELAKHEGFSDLLLECGWRVADWNTDRDTLDQTVKSVMDVPTPRRQVFETFLCLQGYGQEKESLHDLSKLCDEGIQLALRKWHGLPTRFNNAHIPLLHTFQQYVEFMEASQVYNSLVSTNAQNLDVKSQELKRVLQVWRERLPNIWDDINIWNDLVTWRQHAFQVINKVYMPFIPMLQQSNASGNANSYAYRGFHEIAWVINRFAHVARKHGMADVCINQLTKIYQLPNIEIQEAFLKLKEQVKCHYQNPNELNTGLDVISNTNLVFFATQQKAEFFTLKGMFLNKLNQKDEANKAFATAVQIDLNLPEAKPWAEWGMFNDRRFKENPNDMVYANNAISCYLQAAGLYKNGKTRKLLARILWLISLDDASGTLAQAFDNFRGEVPVWYWITFISQLLTALSYSEAKLVKQILIRIAKSYPQALHFQLRTTKEDFAAKQRQFIDSRHASNRGSAVTKSDSTATDSDKKVAEVIKEEPKENGEKNAAETSTSPNTNGTGNANTNASPAGSNTTTPVVPNATAGSPSVKAGSPTATSASAASARAGSPTAPTASNAGSPSATSAKPTPGPTPSANSSTPGKATATSVSANGGVARQSWEHVEEIMGILKTAYPLLALSLESLVDQINQRFKCTADEDAYRLGVALLNDGVQYLNRLGNPRDDAKLPPSTEANITRFAETVLPKQIRSEFEKDLVIGKPNLETYIIKLRKWRDRLEDKLDRRFSEVNLENLCPHLSEFHHQKFEEIEVPGQYLLNKDNNAHFVKIERFLPTLDLVRGSNACYKRLKIRGHDGSLHAFAVQFPAARHCRREECVFQLFRIFGDTLSRKVETRHRNIQFTLPIAVPLSPHIRIINDDSRDVTMQRVYEDFCRRNDKSRDEPFIYTVEKLRAAFDPRLPKPDIMSIKVEILSAIQSLLVPSTVLKNYFIELYPQFEDFWLFRKQFTSQYASFIFSTYMMCVNTRQPQKIHINKGSGSVWTSDMLPCKIASKNASLDGSTGGKPAPLFYNAELVPFRLTPNIQKLIGETGLEGILSVYILAIGRALTEPESDLEQYLTLFVRDEVISWSAQQDPPRSIPQDGQLKEIVRVNVDLIIKRVISMGHISSGPTTATQNVLELISQAVNPRNLAAADTLWMAYF